MHRLFVQAILVMALAMPALAASPAGVVASIRGVALLNDQTAEIGQPVMVGDVLATQADSVVQLLLNDRAAFTLGANAEMTLDAFFVSDAASDIQSTVKRGPFKFFSGQGAKAAPDAMRVKIPSGTIGVRGTQVVGEVIDNATATVLLVGPTENSFGERPGAISVDDGIRVVEVLRAGFVVDIVEGVASDPVQATPDVQDRLNNQTGANSDVALSELGARINAALAELGGSTNVVNTDDLGFEVGERAYDDAGNVGVSNVSLGRGADIIAAEITARIESGGSIGDLYSKLSDATSPSLTGTATYRARGASLVDGWNSTYDSARSAIFCESPCGQFDSTAVLNFDTDEIIMSVDGNVEGLRAANELSHRVGFDYSYAGRASLSDIAVSGADLNSNSRGDPFDPSETYLKASSWVSLSSAGVAPGAPLQSGPVTITQGGTGQGRNNMVNGQNDWTISNFVVTTDPGATPTGRASTVVVNKEVTFYNVDTGTGAPELSAANLHMVIEAQPDDGEATASLNAIILRD